MSSARSFILVVTTAAALGACSAVDLAKREIDRTQAATFTANNDSRQPLPASDVSVIKVKDSVYVGARVQAIDYGDPLPRQFETDAGVTIARARPMRLSEIASLLTQITKIPVVISTDDGGGSIPGAAGTGGTVGGGAAGRPAPVNVGVPQAANVVANAPSDIQSAINQLSGVPGSTVATQTSFSYMDSSSPLEMKLAYTGRLSGLLDLVGSHFNVGWRHNNSRIVFSRVITRTFDLPTLGATQDLEFNLHGGSSSGSSGGSGSGGGSSTTTQLDQKAAIKASFDPWKSIDNSLKQIIGNAGRYDVSPATGTITVTASPAVIQRVGDYVEIMRAMLSKQVAMTVQVLNVTLSSEDSLNNNIGVLFRGSKFGSALGNPATSAAGTDPLNGVIGQLGSASPGLGWAILSGKLAGTSAVVDALSQNGRVSVVTTASLTTVNGAPVPLQVVNRRGYLAQITVQQAATTSTAGSSGVFEQLTPGEVTTGFNMQLLPRVEKDGNLALQYGINISELVGAQNGFDVFSSGGNQIQLPNVNMRNFVQQSIVPNGSTLVLAGFEQVRASDNRSGLLNPDFFQLGGSRDAQNKREVIVILITPTLLDVGAVTSKTRGSEAPRLQEVH